MKDIRTYCKEILGLDLYLDEYLSELGKVLKSKKTKEDKKTICLIKETDGLFRILEKQGYDTKGKRSFICSLTERYMKKELDKTPFESYPLEMITFEEEIENQYRLVDLMHKHFDGFQALNEGDYGCHIKYGRPERTVEVEKVLAEYFGAEDAALVRGGGTGAIRALCFALIRN